MARGKGAYFVKGEGFKGQGQDEDVIDFNSSSPAVPEHGTPAEMPGLWCQWVPGGEYADGQEATIIGWDGGEKFYDAAEWMEYIIGNFLRPGAFASTPEGQKLVKLAGETERFSHFTFDHKCEGVIYAQGEETDDTWRIVVVDGHVEVQSPTVVWPAIPDHLA